MDGLMFDTERLYFDAQSEMLARRGLTFTIEHAQMLMGVHGTQAMAILCRETGLTDQPEDLYAECQSLLRARIETDLQTMPGLFELLEIIETAGLKKALATSTHRTLTEYMLGRYELLSRFEFLLTREDVTQGKPHPEIYLKAAQLVGLPPSEVLVLEDSRNGALAAKSAGCITVAVPHALSRSIDFSFADLTADHLLDERLVRLIRP